MLHFDASSTCDICFDSFSGKPGSMHSPHALECGHIFCKSCLTSMAVRRCPFCQRTFAMSTVRQLYLDTSDVESERHQEIRLVKQYFDNVDSATVRQLYLDSSDVESERLQEIQLVKRYLDTVDSTGVNRVKTEVDKFVNRRADTAISRVVKLKEQYDSYKSKAEFTKWTILWILSMVIAVMLATPTSPNPDSDSKPPST